MPGGIEFAQGKFKDLILYVSERLADDPNYGETKLNKVLFFSDFEAYRELGRPITGAEYQKNLYGPTARLFEVMRDDLLSWHQLEVERRLVGGHVQNVPRFKGVGPNLAHFSIEELEIVDRFINELRENTAVEVSDLSHERSAGWNLVGMGEEIPYRTALISTDPISQDDLERSRQYVRDRGWVTVHP